MRYFWFVQTTGKYPLCQISCFFGPVPRGKLAGSIEARIRIFGLVLRSVDHLYHSLGALWKVAGNPTVAGCWVSSTRRIAEVGLHVFPTYMPEPRNSL